MSELFLQMIITPFKFVIMGKVGTVLKRAGADLSKTYHIFSDTPLGAKIFEFKVDPAPKINDKNLENYFTLNFNSIVKIHQTSEANCLFFIFLC